MVGAGRAAGAGQPRQGAPRGDVDGTLVDPGPDRVERGQPAEQGLVDGEPAGDPLVEVVVGVDQPGREQAAGAVDQPAAAVRARRLPRGRGRGSRADRGDPVALEDDVAGRVLVTRGVHRDEVGALDDGGAHEPAPVHAARVGHPVRRQPHGVQDLLVPRAAAEVAGQRLADLGVGGVRLPGQQVVGLHQQPGGAEAALHRPRLDERLLEGVQVVALREALDRADLAALGLAGGDQAGADRHAVEVDGARTALALLAGVLGPGQAHPLAQDVEQALALPDVVDLATLAVDRGGDAHVRRPSGSRPRPRWPPGGPSPTGSAAGRPRCRGRRRWVRRRR